MSVVSGSPCLRPTLSVEIPTFVDSPVKAKPSRCCFDGCKKKLSLTDFACKCGLIHCSAHRPSAVHNCTFDYKKSHESTLLKTMSTVIAAAKVDKI